MGCRADPLRSARGTRAQLALVAHRGSTTTTTSRVVYRIQAVEQLMAVPQFLWHLKDSNQGQRGAVSTFAYWGLQLLPPIQHQAECLADNTGLLINQGANCSTTMAVSPPWAFVPLALAGAGAITLWGCRQVPLSVGQASATHPAQH